MASSTHWGFIRASLFRDVSVSKRHGVGWPCGLSLASPRQLSWLGLGKTFCIVGRAVDGLAEQRDQVVADVAAGTAFLEIVGSNMGKAQGIKSRMGKSPASEVM